MRNDKYIATKVGERFYDDTEVTITDPCYDNGTWCTEAIKIKSGVYDCIAWERLYKETDYDGKPYEYTRVMRSGIYLKDELDYKICDGYDRFYIGDIGVDAGLAGFFQNKPDYTHTEWHEFVEELKDENGKFRSYQIRPEGFFTESGWGDGGYDVYAYKNKDGEIIGLEIDFEDEEAEDED